MVNRIVFNTKQQKKFYNKPMELPAAAVWNFDQFLMSYIAAGLTWLLEEGNVDWVATGETYGKPNLREDIMKARGLAAAYEKEWDGDDSGRAELGNDALRLIADFGVQFLWD